MLTLFSIYELIDYLNAGDFLMLTLFSVYELIDYLNAGDFFFLSLYIFNVWWFINYCLKALTINIFLICHFNYLYKVKILTIFHVSSLKSHTFHGTIYFMLLFVYLIIIILILLLSLLFEVFIIINLINLKYWKH